MTTYSKPRPSGGYDYFQAPGKLALGDDLPIPRLRVVKGIGAASTSSGRRMPPEARRVGSGQKARGLVTALDPSKRLGKIQLAGETTPERLRGFLAGAVFVGTIWVALEYAPKLTRS